MPENIIDETDYSIANTATLTPPPKSSKSISDKGKQSSSLVTPSPKQPSVQLLALHAKWQKAAEAMGGKEARIVVAKDVAKQIIFDMLKDSFRPMNITEIYNALKAVVPSPLLKGCLDDMTDSATGNPFDDDSDDETKEASAKKNAASDPFTSSLLMKRGRNSNTTLYFVDYNKLRNNGNGLLPNEREELMSASQSTSLEEQQLKGELKKVEDLTKKLLSEPTNEEANNALEILESEMSALEEKLDSLRAYKVNEGTRKKIHKRVDELTSVWRKRRRLTTDFLLLIEESTEGTVSMKKCLNGDGQIYMEGDDYAIQQAREAAKAKTKKKFGVKRPIKLASKSTLSNENKTNHTESFVGVKLDNIGNISRIHFDEE